MIALRKLESLATGNRLKKAADLLRGFELEIRRGRPVDGYYLAGLCALLRRSDTSDAVIEAAEQLEADLRAEGLSLSQAAREHKGRRCGVIRSLVLSTLGSPVAEWDFCSGETGKLDPESRRVLPFELFLEDLRSPFNVGSIFRSAEAFGVRHIYLSPASPLPDHPRALRSSMGAVDVMEWSVCDFEEARRAFLATASVRGSVLALETGGTPLKEFTFPPEGLLVLGNEEWGISAEVLARADARVSIPMGGAKASLNVAVAAGVVLQRWSEPEI